LNFNPHVPPTNVLTLHVNLHQSGSASETTFWRAGRRFRN